MRFHYVPSTYRGRKFGKGFCGGAYRGCARICGGALDDNLEDTPGPVAVPVNIPVQPAQIQQNLLDFPDITPDMIERARRIIALAEATGKAQPITKKEAGIWSGIKNIGSKIWSGAKAVASNPLVQTAASMAAPYLIGAVAPTLASYVPKALDSVGRYAYNKLDPIYHQEAIVNKSAGDNFKEIKDNLSELATKGVANAVGTVAAAPAAIANAAISAPANVLGWQANILKKGANAVRNAVGNALKSGWNRWWRGSGYRGGRRARLRKGSPEAKAYMARLRAMRGKKKRSGGMLPKNYINLLKNSPIALRTPIPNLYKNFRGSGYRGGMFRGVKMNDLVEILRMVKGDPDNTEVNIDWVDREGNKRTTTTTKGNIKSMMHGTIKMKNYYKHYDEKGKLLNKPRTKEEEDAFRAQYIQEHYGKSAWPYKNMSYRRFNNMQRSLKWKKKDWDYINDYWDQRTKDDEDKTFYNRFLQYNFYDRSDPSNKLSKYHGDKKGRMRRNVVSQIRLIRQKKDGLINDLRLAHLIPNIYRIDRTSKRARKPKKYGPVSKRNIIEGERKGKQKIIDKIMKEKNKKNVTKGWISDYFKDAYTRPYSVFKPTQPAKTKKRKKAAPADDLSPTLSDAAAANAITDVSTGPPPAAIMPGDNVLAAAASADVPIINEIRNRIATQMKRAQRIKDAASKAKILKDINNLNDFLGGIEEGLGDGENEDENIKTANKRIRQITKVIGETLKLQ